MTPQARARAYRLATVALCLGAGLHCRGGDDARTPARAHDGPDPGLARFVDSSTGQSVDADPMSVEFGRVRLHETERRELRVTNDGRATFTVSAIAITPELSDPFTASPARFDVPPGTQVSFSVAFHPTAAGAFTGSLRLVVENADRAALTVLVSGTGYHGEGPEIAVAPASVDFGAVPPGGSASRRITVANVGVDVIGTTADNVQFARLAESGAFVDSVPEITGPDAAEFSLDWPPQGYDAAGLSEGETVDLVMHFHPSSIAGKHATLVIASNDPTRARVEVALSGVGFPMAPCDLELTPRVLNFGALGPNEEATVQLSVVHPHASPPHDCRIASLNLSASTLAEGAFALPNGPWLDQVLPSGGSVLVPVRFLPKHDGAFTGEIALEFYGATTGDDHSHATVALAGVAHQACLMVVPRELDFGTVGLDCSSRPRSFALYNGCSSSITVTAIALAESSPVPEFTLAIPPALPLAIPGGEDSEFGVSFAPTEVGDHTAAVTVSQAGRAADVTVPLQGRGAVDPVQTDGFSQFSSPKVDVLFVVDDSSSMADKQSTLAINFSAFVRDALSHCLDLHLGVTTTDVSSSGAAGRLLPLAGTNPRVITSATPNAASLFVANAAVGTSGSETESLLRPAYLALSNALLATHNAGFYRDDAKLAIVIVSDAADQDPLSTSPADYESFLLGLKGLMRRNDLTVSAVIPTLAQAPEGCCYDSPTASSDTRVRQVVQHTGGLLADICDPNWAMTLRFRGSIDEHLYCGPYTRLPLSNSPDLSRPDPIVMTVDNLPLAPYDRAGFLRWHYEPANNEVVLDPEVAVDLVGSTIAVSYHVACLE